MRDYTDTVAALTAQLEASVNGASPGLELVGHREIHQLTWRTLADVAIEPPKDLLLGMIEPDAQTLLYGKGGVGKGSTTAWLCVELMKLGIKPLVYDAEQRPDEWRRRIEGLGGDPNKNVYVEPWELPGHLIGKPLWEITPHLGQIADAADCGILVVDSILAGMGVGEDRLKSDAAAPYTYVRALQALGIPSVSIGHTSKGSPEGDPYGSVSWVNAMRLTWLGTKAEGDGHIVRWRPRKRNQRGRIAPVRLTFTYDLSNTLTGVARADDDKVTRDWLIAALYQRPRTVEELAEEIIEEEDEWGPSDLERVKARLRQTLGRMRIDGQASKPKKRGGPWSLSIE